VREGYVLKGRVDKSRGMETLVDEVLGESNLHRPSVEARRKLEENETDQIPQILRPKD
jgi:hypothetical protein